MEFKEIIALSVTILLAVAGWMVSHGLSVKREIEQKKREIRVQHLREAYLKLANVADTGDLETNILDIQRAFNDIQLFGELSQIDLIERIIRQVTEEGSAKIDDLLKELRNEIREHIGLKRIDEYRLYIRVEGRPGA